ncbi:DUF4350 domain-containing protein [Natronomonas salina]|uniref:DUF4350 domain-containing protein n=1 Tax=Natronomonas salina TaxID=1710540 RepID=UPI0015B5CF67|nr:DUF4350 domain-containing protein [Natronomonas salina]QLD88745.1 DUF4350 domain-containing protein [Natronomonas salina]
MRYDVPTVIAAALVVAVTVTFVFGGATSAAAFNAFNPNWDGTSELRSIADDEGAEPIIVRNTTEYDDYGDGDVAFVLAPESAYSGADSQRIRRFVENGGTLVVADRNNSHGAALLDSVGATARPVGPTLRDERENYRNPAMPVANDVGNHSLVENVSALTLNHGTAVAPNGATVLVASSEYSYLDRDGSASLGADETVQSYPVATVESVGQGRVIVVGDPSVFINVMQGQAGNEAFTRALVADANHTLVDVSQSSLPPLVAAVLTIRDSALLQVGIGLGGLAAVALTGRRLRNRRTRDPETPSATDASALTAGLKQRYPALESAPLEKVTTGVIRNPDERDDNE